MLVECIDSVYDISLSHAQIEITGCCNMKCKHCRAVNEKNIFMPIDKIKLILDFVVANMNNSFNLTISGGESLLHPEFIEIMRLVRRYPFNEIVITTNGSLITESMLEELDEMEFSDLTLQISLDSIHATVHDENRNSKGSFKKAIDSIKQIEKRHNISSSVRMTINPATINEIEEMTNMLIPLGVRRLGVGNIIPAGLGASSGLLLSKMEKYQFLKTLSSCQKKYSNQIEIVTEDPLKCLVGNTTWAESNLFELERDEGVFGGCTAGIDCFNVDTRYNFTPCSVFNETILNLNDCSTVADIERQYADSALVKRLLERNFDGKCGRCTHKQICGGCRAQAKYYSGSYFGSDETCWMEETDEE